MQVVLPDSSDLEAEIRRLAPGCDVGLVIAPDHLLTRFTRTLEEVCHNIGCGAMNVAVAANKQRAAAILAAHDIPVPAEQADAAGGSSNPSGAAGRSGSGSLTVRPGRGSSADVYRGREPLGLAGRKPGGRRCLRVLVGRSPARPRPEPTGDRGRRGRTVPLSRRRDSDQASAQGRVSRGGPQGRRGAGLPGFCRGRPCPGETGRSWSM